VHPLWISPFSYAAFSGQAFLTALVGACGDGGHDPEPASGSRLAGWAEFYREQYAALWQGPAEQASTGEAAPEARRDGSAWRDGGYFDFLQRHHGLQTRALRDFVDALDVDPVARQRMHFCARQFSEALHPANFLATNPQALDEALKTQGRSLAQGMLNLLGDLQRGRLSITDESAYELGRDLAATPGSVIFENEIMQLIQYAPATDHVRARPLVIVPPCINKYYILDLSPHNSFVRYAVEQGNTVFMISWRNIDAHTGHLGWDDYIEQGVLAAIDIARAVCDADQVNALGYCVGGTMLGTALAVTAARGAQPAASVTLLATLLDFSDTGEIGLFVDESIVQHFESALADGGVRRGRDLADVFAVLRGSDVIWPYVANNYLLGKSPPGFDVLYWNEDCADLAGPWYCWYLRNTYLENRLCTPGAATVCGVPVDLRKLDMPSYVLATQEDHIVPWRTAYRSMQALAGHGRFVLGASGHVAGVINPARRNARGYRVGDASAADAEAWHGSAAECSGSWWCDWDAWLAKQNGDHSVAAPIRAGSAQYVPIERAPGRYVRERAA
jgi:polyhydroxyalkanoate synthase